MGSDIIYIWQREEWPRMTWRNVAVSGLLAEVNLLRGKLLGRVSMFGFEEQNISMLESLTQEIVHSAKIEGEDLNRDSVRSSLAMHLGLPYEGLPVADHYTEGVVRKVHFWERHRETNLNERQRKVINMLFDGFEGKLNSSKWYKINHCSQDTAIRDINDLIGKGILRQTDEKGRSTNYELVMDE